MKVSFHDIYLDKQNPPANRRICSIQVSSISEGVTLSILIETVGAIARMGILHEVTSGTVSGTLGTDFPVTVGFNHRADIADGGSEVSDSEPGTCLCGSESLAA